MFSIFSLFYCLPQCSYSAFGRAPFSRSLEFLLTVDSLLRWPCLTGLHIKKSAFTIYLKSIVLLLLVALLFFYFLMVTSTLSFFLIGIISKVTPCFLCFYWPFKTKTCHCHEECSPCLAVLLWAPPREVIFLFTQIDLPGCFWVILCYYETI